MLNFLCSYIILNADTRWKTLDKRKRPWKEKWEHKGLDKDKYEYLGIICELVVIALSRMKNIFTVAGDTTSSEPSHCFFYLHQFPSKDVHLSLKAGEEVDEEGVPHGVGHLEDPLLGQEGLHLVASNDIPFLQGLYGEIFPSVLVACQDNLEKHSQGW